MSCLDWCRYGKECIGYAAYDNYMANRAIGLKKQLRSMIDKTFLAETGKDLALKSLLNQPVNAQSRR